MFSILEDRALNDGSLRGCGYCGERGPPLLIKFVTNKH